MSRSGPSVSWYESPYYIKQSSRVTLRESESSNPPGTSRITESAPSPEHCSLFKRKFSSHASDPDSEFNDDDDILPPLATASSESVVTPVRRIDPSRSKTTPRSIGFNSGRQAAELLKMMSDEEDLEEIDENFCDGNPEMPLSIRRSSLVLCEEGKEVPNDRPYVPVKITGHPIRSGSPTGPSTRKRHFGFSSPLLMGPPRSASTPKPLRNGHNQSPLAMKTVVNEAFAAVKKAKFDDSLDDAETDFLLSQVCAASVPAAKPIQPPQQYAVANKSSLREAAPQASAGSLPDTPKAPTRNRARCLTSKTRSLLVLPFSPPVDATQSGHSGQSSSKRVLSSAGQSPSAGSSGKSASFELPRDDSFYDDDDFDNPEFLDTMAASEGKRP